MQENGTQENGTQGNVMQENGTQENETQEQEKEKKIVCPLCGEKLVFKKEPTGNKKLKSIACSQGDYDSKLKQHIGCDFALYSKQKILDPKVLNKAELKRLVQGERLTIDDKYVYMDTENPVVLEGKGDKPPKTIYLRVDFIPDEEEDV